jgi:hypothetical protein
MCEMSEFWQGSIAGRMDTYISVNNSIKTMFASISHDVIRCRIPKIDRFGRVPETRGHFLLLQLSSI